MQEVSGRPVAPAYLDDAAFTAALVDHGGLPTPVADVAASFGRAAWDTWRRSAASWAASRGTRRDPSGTCSRRRLRASGDPDEPGVTAASQASPESTATAASIGRGRSDVDRRTDDGKSAVGQELDFVQLPELAVADLPLAPCPAQMMLGAPSAATRSTVALNGASQLQPSVPTTALSKATTSPRFRPRQPASAEAGTVQRPLSPTNVPTYPSGIRLARAGTSRRLIGP